MTDTIKKKLNICSIFSIALWSFTYNLLHLNHLFGNNDIFDNKQTNICRWLFISNIFLIYIFLIVRWFLGDITSIKFSDYLYHRIDYPKYFSVLTLKLLKHNLNFFLNKQTFKNPQMLIHTFKFIANFHIPWNTLIRIVYCTDEKQFFFICHQKIRII